MLTHPSEHLRDPRRSRSHATAHPSRLRAVRGNPQLLGDGSQNHPRGVNVAFLLAVLKPCPDQQRLSLGGLDEHLPQSATSRSGSDVAAGEGVGERRIVCDLERIAAECLVST